MFPKINLKYASKKKKQKSKPLTPRTVRAIDDYVKSLHTRESMNLIKININKLK